MIKKILCALFFCSVGFSAKHCFLAQEVGKVMMLEGECETRYAPCSTFKIPLALMGYDAKILKDETHPEWPFEEKYEAFLETWKNPQNPTTWIKNSCVWYSQVLTQKLGAKCFGDYVAKLNYGNQDISGDKGKDNGLTQCWLSSSLELSPKEQAEFLEKLLKDALPVSKVAHQLTRAILFVEDLPGGWKLYGKTGSGYLLNEERTQKLELKHGWFAGWIEKAGRRIVFVHHIVDDQKEAQHAGPRAKVQAKEKLLQLIKDLEAHK